MGFKYKIEDQQEVYFLTSTVVDWVDVFTRRELAEIVIDSLRYCQKEKGRFAAAIDVICLVSNAESFTLDCECGRG